jgi:multisubunit Na+/H+ antiporter MnhC subunit
MGKKILSVLFPLLGMLALILDAACSVEGAAEGISLCLRTVIPSLFPLFVISSMISHNLAGMDMRFLRPLGRLLHLPRGGEALFLLGVTSGYPVGAKMLAEACQTGRLKESNFRRMIAFCSNTGPGFLFGIGAMLFPDRSWCFAAWGIHIFTALLIGCLTPGSDEESIAPLKSQGANVTDALYQALRSTAIVCGWVVIFRVLLTFLQRWVFWMFPAWLSILLQGFLELTNGCCALYQIEDADLRFIFFSIFLGFGGICVTMQTMSICTTLPTSMYLPGKLTQALLSGLLSAIWVSQDITMVLQFGICILLVCFLYYLFSHKGQKRLDFKGKMQYNL